jgi:hypothetical protein
MHDLNEIVVRLTEIQMQIGRLVSDAESEKEFRKERNREIEKRLRDLEKWRSEMHGRIVVTVSIATLVASGLIAITVKLIK